MIPTVTKRAQAIGWPIQFPEPDLSATQVLTDQQFELFRMIARRHAGIMIADFKRSMVFRRIKRRMTALSITDVGAYCDLLSGPDGKSELQPLINALTTNKTEFFRERHHFDHMCSVVIPSLVAQQRTLSSPRRLRIWSAGCSTGEEPYTIAMSLGKTVDAYPGWDIKILATDIDTDVIERARHGMYRASDLAAVPPDLRQRYFERSDAKDSHVQASAALRRLITFKPLNLHHAWPMRGQFDVVFCRNVVIYFDKETQRSLFGRIADVIAPGGYLYCGHSESLYGISQRFRAAGQSIYQRIS